MSTRFNHWLIFLTPKLGCCPLSSTILALTVAGSLLLLLLFRPRGRRPASPCCWYFLTHSKMEQGLSPICSAISLTQNPSSSRNLTALSRNSKG